MSEQQDPDALFTDLSTKIDELITQITAFSARTTPDEFRRALDDQLAARGLLAQVVEVVNRWREQIQALTEAYTRLSVAVKTHDETSSSDRRDLRELMGRMDLLLVSLTAMARSQVRHLHDIGIAVGANPIEAELRRLQMPEQDKGKPEDK